MKETAGPREALSRRWLADRVGETGLTGARIAVTGGSGFIGTNLVGCLVNLGAEVLNLDVASPANEDQTRYWRLQDVLDGDGLAAALNRFEPEIVFHLAAETAIWGPGASYPANTIGMANLLAAAETVGSLRRLIVTSSQLVCRPGYVPTSDTDYAPHTSYGRSKVRMEELVRAWQDPTCPWTIVRPTSIWGPWFGVPYRDFFVVVSRNRFLNARGIHPRRSSGFIGNVVNQYLRLAEAPADLVAGRTFYQADLHVTELRRWAELVRRKTGARPIREVRLPLLRLAARAGDLSLALGAKSVPLSTFRLTNMLQDNIVDMEPTRRVAPTDPFDLEEAVEITVAWMRDRGII